MFPNYPGGGYCAPGGWKRLRVWQKALTEDERLFTRLECKAQAEADGLVCTLYDETPPPAPASLHGVVTDEDDNPVAGATVQLLSNADFAVSREGTTNASGEYAITAPAGGGDYVVCVLPTSQAFVRSYRTIGSDPSMRYGGAITLANEDDVTLDLTLFSSLDPTAVAGDLWDATDHASFDGQIAGQPVTTWLNQLPGRPAFDPTEALHPAISFYGPSSEWAVTVAVDRPLAATIDVDKPQTWLVQMNVASVSPGEAAVILRDAGQLLSYTSSGPQWIVISGDGVGYSCGADPGEPDVLGWTWRNGGTTPIVRTARVTTGQNNVNGTDAPSDHAETITLTGPTGPEIQVRRLIRIDGVADLDTLTRYAGWLAWEV
jgi:hypothetical protein